MPWWALLWAILAVSGLLACSGAERDDREVTADVAFPDAPGVDVADTTTTYAFVDACDRWVEARCRVLTCQGSFESLTLCREVNAEICAEAVRPLIANQIDLGGLGYDEAAAAACLGPFIAASCEDVTGLVAAPPAACDGILTGDGAVGDACDFDAMCAPGLFCAPDGDGACPGTCEPRLGPGEVCDAVGRLCAAGSGCVAAFFSGLEDDTCLALDVADGAACVASVQCRAGSWCGPGGVCVDALADGAPCDEVAACASGWCEPADGVCGAIPGDGDACSVICASGFVCAGDPGVCVPEPSVAGEPCLDATFPCGTGSGLACDAATASCQPFPAVGAACGGSDAPFNCDGGYCDGTFAEAGTCQPFRGVGDACAGHAECGLLLRCGDDGRCGLGLHPCRGASLAPF